MSGVLLVEDDPPLRRVLRASFSQRGFEVTEAGSGEEGLVVASVERPDLVVLDLTLPGIDGLDVIRTLRGFSAVPVLVLTVRDELHDKVAAFEAGADDYVVKPFQTEELIARARAHLRRGAGSVAASPVLRSGDLVIDLARRRITRHGVPVALTPIELRLLEVLVTNRGKLLTREQLLERVWDAPRPTDRNRLRVTVLHLRRKLGDDAARPRLIFTEPGLGYRWVAEHEEDEATV